jgi:hypothetical protein
MIRSNDMRITDEYAAGVIEGLVRIRSGSCGRGHGLRVEISVLLGDKHMADALRDHFDAGKVESFHPRSNPQITLWNWTVRGGDATGALQRTIPHMVGYLKAAAEHTLAKVTGVKEPA